jgi:hypothetical protein
MPFPDPSSQQYYPSPMGPGFSSTGTSNAAMTPVPNARTDTRPGLSLNAASPVTTPEDVSFGNLFKGVGNIVDTITKATDTVIKDDIQKQVYAGVDKIRGEFGVDEATRIAGEGQGIIPPGGKVDKTMPNALQRLGAQVQGLADAHDAGMSDSYYSARLEVLSRRVREQYPGYRPEIDEMFSKATGQIPANTLRAKLNSDVTELQKKMDAKATEYDKFLVSNAGNLPPGYQNMSPAAVKAFVIDSKGFEYRKDELRKPLLTEGPDGIPLTATQRQEKGEAAFTGIATQTVSQIISQGTEGVTSPAQIQKMILDQKLGRAPKWSPDEKAAIVGQLDYYEKTITSAIMFEAMKPHTPGQPGNLLADIRDPKRVQEIVDQALVPVKGMKDALVNQNFGIFGAEKGKIEAIKDAKTLEFMTDPTIVNATVLKNTLGDTGLNSWLTYADKQGKTPLGEIVRGINERTLAQTSMTPSGKTPLFDSLSKRAEKGVAASPAELRSTLSMHVAAATDPEIIKNTPPQNRVNSLTNTYMGLEQLYEKGVIPVKEYRNLLQTTINNNVTKGITDLNNPQLTTTYSEYAQRAFSSAYMNKVGDVNAFVKSPNYEVKWDDTFGRLVSVWTVRSFLVPVSPCRERLLFVT